MLKQNYDSHCVRRCLNGDPEAFQELLDQYKNQIFSFLYRIVQNPSDAEDLAQESFIKAFRNLASYDLAHPFITWLFKIAHNTAIDFMRAKKPQALSIDDDDNPIEVEDAGHSLEKVLDLTFQKKLIEKLLAAIPPLYREALILRHQEGLDYEKISQILQIPEGTVKIRLFRARDILKRKLEAMGFEG